MAATAPLSIDGGRRLTDDRPGQLLIDQGRIIEPDRARPHDGGCLSIDAHGLLVAPGFVDLQINGGFGIDLATDPEAMWELGRLLPRHGVTAFLPTIVSSPPTVTDRALASLARRPADHTGAEPLGLHFEGPMLNRDRSGAHELDNLVEPDLELVARWTADHGVALVTLAPELPGALDVIQRLTGAGVTVAAGHTLATSAQAVAGVEAGMTMVTHLFNAMGPISHRAPGLAGAALTDDGVSVGLIVDGVHVDPLMVKLAWRAKGPRGVVLVSDAVAAMGLDPGRYEFGNQVVTADATTVRTEDGVLAGSVLTMDRAVANTMAFTGCSLPDAVAAASTTPAAAVGSSDRGHLDAGAVADVVLLESDGTVAITICRGDVAYVAPGHDNRLTTTGSLRP